MNVRVMVKYHTNIDLKPGTPCAILTYYGASEKVVKIKKIVESTSGTYVVFEDGTHRPLSTYSKTWTIA